MQTPASSTAFVETLSFDDPTLANALFGPHNAHLNVIAERTGADLSTRGTTLAVTSDDPALRERILNLFTQFYGLLRSGHALQSSDLEQGLQLLESDPGSDLRRSFRDEAVLSLPKKTVTARNAAQRAYLETLRSNEMVFSVGPAGTGKTYLAVAMAVHMLNARRVRRIILTRLGFGSRAAITGDITQIDLPAQGEDSASRSGLVHALHVLKGVKGVAFRHFTSADVVRHPLVGRIVQAYDDYEKLPSSHQ